MKSVLLFLFLFNSLMFFGQTVSVESSDVTMELRSVVEVNQLSQYYVKVANTDPIVLNYCDKFIRIPPGVHLVVVNIGSDCRLILSGVNWVDLETLAHSSRVVIGGLRTIDYYTNQVIRVEDYIEYIICNPIFMEF